MTSSVEHIWMTFSSRLRSFIRSRVRDHAAAEDILQEVFLKIHQKLPALRSSDLLAAWIWRIARNAIVDYFRRARPQEPLSAQLPDAAENGPELPDLKPCVRRFVQQLSPPYRQALLLTEWENLSQQQLAKRLGLSASGAKSRVQRARQQLRKLMLDCCRFELDQRGTVIDFHSRDGQKPRCGCAAK